MSIPGAAAVSVENAVKCDPVAVAHHPSLER